MDHDQYTAVQYLEMKHSNEQKHRAHIMFMYKCISNSPFTLQPQVSIMYLIEQSARPYV